MRSWPRIVSPSPLQGPDAGPQYEMPIAHPAGTSIRYGIFRVTLPMTGCLNERWPPYNPNSNAGELRLRP
jgi:hypothetical protein